MFGPARIIAKQTVKIYTYNRDFIKFILKTIINWHIIINKSSYRFSRKF
jgi:hypothetical protein